MNKLLLNEKHLLLPVVALVLVATMLMTTMANAVTTVYVNNVESSSGITNPSRVEGPPDASYAIFAGSGSGSEIIVKLPVAPPAGAQVWIRAYSAGTSTVQIYSASSATGPWNYIGQITVSTSVTVYTSSGCLPSGQRYIGLFVSGSTCYIDAIGVQY